MSQVRALRNRLLLGAQLRQRLSDCGGAVRVSWRDEHSLPRIGCGAQKIGRVFRHHHCSLLILLVGGDAILGDGDGRSGCRTETHRDHRRSGGSGPLRLAYYFIHVLETFTVTHQYNCALCTRPGKREEVVGLTKRARERTARLTDDCGIKVVDEQVKPGLVNSNWTEHVTFSRKRDQRKTIVGREITKSVHHLLHFRKSIRRLVTSEHR